MTHPKSRLAALAEDILTNVFMERMNVPLVLPPEFDAERMRRVREEAEQLPDCTEDITPDQHFSRKFTLDDIARVKARIRSNSLGRSTGADKKGYKAILEIPNEVLLELFNACLEMRNVPTLWLTTLLAAILKRNLDPKMAASYRTIGLECCLLKFLTMLMDARIREWLDTRPEVLPKSQNGFRAGYRTNNNTFILRCAAERARADGKVLYLASVDISNAFPSVNHDLLFLKLYNLGMRGPIFDVYRTIYERMAYCVRVDGRCAEAFTSDMGILIGDPASPIMWLLFFADLEVPEVLDDILLGGTRVSHLEQADDIVMFGTSRAAVQAKLDAFYAWCCRAFLQINKKKSWWMPLGCSPVDIGTISFSIGGEIVPLKASEKYVGLRITSEKKNLFAEHSREKAATAYALASSVFGVIDGLCLQCPPTTARHLYTAMIDPHLTHGCDVSPDATRAATLELERAQNLYLRKLLRAGKRCSVAALFTETGIWPVRYRRADLLVRYLGYLLQRPSGDYARLALQDSVNLFLDGRQSWYGDLHKALRLLPHPVDLGNDPIMEAGEVEEIRDLIKQSMLSYLHGAIAVNQKLFLLHSRPNVVCVESGRYGTGQVMAFRAYLKLRVPDHRVALTRVLLSTHGLAVERLRWQGVQRSERLCRWCHTAVEDPVHALLQCGASDEVVRLRTELFAKLGATDPKLLLFLLRLSDTQIVRVLAVHEPTLPMFARFTCKVMNVFTAKDL